MFTTAIKVFVEWGEEGNCEQTASGFKNYFFFFSLNGKDLTIFILTPTIEELCY
jgi:hypothetical protein